MVFGNVVRCSQSSRVARWTASLNLKERGGGAMDTYEVLSLLFLGGSFLIALLVYGRHE